METQTFLTDVETQDTEVLKIALRQIVNELRTRDLDSFVKELHEKTFAEYKINKDEAERDVQSKMKRRETEAAEKLAAEKLANQWEVKKIQSEELLKTLQDCDNVYFQVWKSNDGEKRVYVQDGEPFGKRTVNIACLYITGNTKNKPGSLELLSSKRIADDVKLKEVLMAIGKHWGAVKVSVNEAIS